MKRKTNSPVRQGSLRMVRKSEKAAKSNEKSKKVEKPAPKTNNNPFGREFFGLFLIAVAIICSISLISQYVMGGNGNILGEYLGVWLAQALTLLAGTFPSVLLVSVLVISGFKFIQPDTEGEIDYRLPLIAFTIFLLICVMLSVKNIAQTTLDFEQFPDSGGFLGNFIVQQVMVPVFGRTTFGPYLVGILLLVFTIIWGFKIRVSQAIEKTTVFLGILIFPIFDAFDTLKLKRARRREKIREKVFASPGDGKEARQLELPEEVALFEPPLEKGKSKKIKLLQKSIQEDIDKVTADLARYEMMNPEDVEGDDPLEVRRKRDRLKELKRIAELNQWEVIQRDPTIGGLVKSDKNKKARKMTSKVKQPLPEEEIVLEKYPDPLVAVDADSLLPSEKEALETPVAIDDTDLEGADADYATGPDASAGRESLVPLKKKAATPPQPPPHVKFDKYVVPDIDSVLEDPPHQAFDVTEKTLKDQGRALEEQLANFKVMGKVIGICSGPVITRYEVELAPGVKVNQISGLSDDLAMALRATSIRILAPIPGKSAVGIEVPNKMAQIVYIKEILKSDAFKLEADTIRLVLGKDIAGEPCTMDLTKAPHLLIAGQTGSGKSVCINSFMASILCSKTPDEVRMILVDPKVVELKPYDQIPHLLSPVITQPETAVQALKWATVEMDGRYNLLARAGVRNIAGFNQKFRSGALKNRMKAEQNKLLPYIIIVIDELADLMMVAGKEVETNIARIAQKARAVGLHLILATQRPSTNVITGTIKANLPTRVAFQVASHIDARTIMDKAGCEKLLGRGDMLFRSINSPDPERIHGSFVADHEAEALAKACAGQFVNYPHVSTFDLEEIHDGMSEEDERPRDAKFRDAAELIVSLRQGSVSMLQRRMAIGYARAGRIMDQLERAGIVGRDRGSKPREVLMDELELQSFLSSGLND